VLIILTALSALFIAVLFIWAAIKDGQDQDERDARVLHRHWPSDT
jgi:nitrogen fixation-related uncharacterized protein